MEEKIPDRPHFKLIYQRYYQLKLRKKFGKIDLNSRDIWNNTPLHNALKYGHEELARCLIKSGACVNHVDTDGNTPLHLAARTGTTSRTSIDTVRLLLKHMSDVNSKNNRGFTPLHEAVYAENVKTAKWSIINYYYGDKSNDTISIPNTLYCVYDYNGSKFFKRARRDPPIWAMKNTTTMVRILVEAGADVNHQTAEGWTPLHFAVERSLVDVVDILLQNGASVVLTAQNLPECLLLPMPRKIRALYRVVFKVVNDSYIKLHSGTTVLHQAAELDIPNIARVIVDKGADINAQDSRGKTALHIAVDNFQYHIVEFLIFNGANINIKDNYGHVPLANIFFDCFDFDLDFQRKMVKYIVLWQNDQQHLFMKGSRISSALQPLWNHCEDDVNKMKDFIFEESNISLYTILRHIFNEHQLAEYLKNKSIAQSLSDFICNDIYCTIFPRYEELIRIIPFILIPARARNLELEKLILISNEILPQLPPEIVLKIGSYLNNYDLTNFLLSVCEI
ncbi:unnamed protein product [Diabrotica balteata]|uniref:Uncharacterized protein n=1 Tax=Diabrotica balteata TaxID=107213 RepID=A0A9P0DWL9_DIABA|nr:unnamed protein product [Diabrotica balteata]